jgi:flagellar assembly factor FliW
MARHAHATHDSPPPTAAPAAPITDIEGAITFPDGIPGFEACRRFVLLVSEATAPLQRLESVEGPPAAFVGIDPRLVVPGYRCRLAAADLRSLQAREDTPLVWLALVTVETDGTIAVNLRAPIVVNPTSMTGRQVLPNDGLYPVRHVVATEGQ